MLEAEDEKFGGSEGVRRFAKCWRETSGCCEVEERGNVDVEREVSGVGRGVGISVATKSCITPALAGSGKVTGT